MSVLSRSGKPVAVPSYSYDVIECMVCSEKKAPRVMDPICDDCIASGDFPLPSGPEALRSLFKPSPPAPESPYDLPPEIMEILAKTKAHVSFLTGTLVTVGKVRFNAGNDATPITQPVAKAVLSTIADGYRKGLGLRRIAEVTNLTKEEVAHLMLYAKKVFRE